MGRPLRHDPRLLARHGPDPGRRVLRRRRVGYLRLQSRPVSGEQMAACVANGVTPELIKPFELNRFTEGLVGGGRSCGGALIMLLVPCPYCGPMNAADLSYNGSRTADPTRRPARPRSGAAICTCGRTRRAGCSRTGTAVLVAAGTSRSNAHPHRRVAGAGAARLEAWRDPGDMK